MGAVATASLAHSVAAEITALEPGRQCRPSMVGAVVAKALVLISLALLPSRAMAETVQQFIAGFVQDFDNLDWPRFRARFSDDSTVFFPPAYGAARATGRAETDPAWLRTFESIRAASGVSAPPYMHLQPRDLLVQDWPGGAVVTFTLGGGTVPLNRRTLVLRPEGDSFVIVHLHGSTLLPVK